MFAFREMAPSPLRNINYNAVEFSVLRNAPTLAIEQNYRCVFCPFHAAGKYNHAAKRGMSLLTTDWNLNMVAVISKVPLCTPRSFVALRFATSDFTSPARSRSKQRLNFRAVSPEFGPKKITRCVISTGLRKAIL